jgi:uncharacterized membrane protein
MPEIPDFTDASWQTRRTNSQLLESILDGKGPDMPPSRDEISDPQGLALVAFVRDFAPSAGSFNQERSGALDKAATGEPTAPEDFLPRLIRWLGNFHSPCVHFPIALLTAAAVAEILRVITGSPSFDPVSRFCVWFGTLSALVAAMLGWFMSGFRLTDPSWVLTTHRWLGTATAVGSLPVLVLSEWSQRSGCMRTRTCFRVLCFILTAMVAAAGFFGGAVVFGINHYAWPGTG